MLLVLVLHLANAFTLRRNIDVQGTQFNNYISLIMPRGVAARGVW